MKLIAAFLALTSALAVSAQTTTAAATTTDFIYITSPIAGTVFNYSKTAKITWKFTTGTGAPTFVNIDLLDNLALVQNIASGVKPTAGSYSWTVPANITSSLAYSIRLIDANNTGASAYASYSHYFEIDGPTGKPTDTPSSSVPASSTVSTTATALNTTSAVPTTSAVSTAGNSTSLNSTASRNTTTTTASGAAVKAGGNCLVALGIFAAALAML